MSLATQQWTCTECGKKFKVGEWTCADGNSHHVVANKTYLLADAPSDPGVNKRDGRTRICNIPPDRTVLRHGETALIPGGYVEFIRGRFDTTNPEIQHYLDRKGGFVSEAQWEAAWYTDTEKLNIERMRLTADRQRLENERNELLAQQKQRVGA